MKRLTTGLFVLVLALTGVACGDPDSGGRSGGSQSVNALAAAADKASEAGSSAVRMTITMSDGGQELEMEGDGTFDFIEQTGEMTMTISGTGVPSGAAIDMIIEGKYMYMKLPEELGGLGDGWYRMDMGEMPGYGSGAPNQLSQDPTQYLEFLRGASDGEVEEVGTEKIDGVSTTHYRADLSFDKIVETTTAEEDQEKIRAQMEALGGSVGDSIPADVWVDDDGLPRRMEMKMSFEAAGETADMEMRMDFFDYGIDVAVEAPEDYEDITPSG